MKPYSHSDLNLILDNFSVNKKQYAFTPLTDGYINDTFLVLDDATPSYILQRVNHNVFKNVEGIMNNIENAFRYLDAADYQKIALVEGINGKGFWKDKKGATAYWRLMTYIDKSIAHNTTQDPKIAFEAGRIIGRFHQLLLDANINDYVDTIPRFHDLNLRKEQFHQALSTTVSDKKKIAQSAIDFTHKILSVLANLNPTELPVRLCHNDTKLNNILFAKETGKALCLIDLDTMMQGRFLFDFGDAVRTIVNIAPEDEKDHTKITFEKALFESFVDGLAINKDMFSAKEIQTMHWGAVLMPFLHGIRALTDYLNGNIYYKVAYENQNLDRCLSLFDFTNKALNQKAYMEETLNEKLG